MNILEQLETIIADRSTADTSHSWTAKLLKSGKERCAQKFGEEAVETVIAGSSGQKKQLIHEASDTLYHLMVLLKANDVNLGEIETELQRRQKLSGMEEKDARTRDQ